MPFPFRQNLFQPQEEELQTAPPIPQSELPPPKQSIADIYGQLANTDTGPANKAYRDFLGTQPKREDFQPTKMSKVGAILSGVSEGIKHGGAEGIKAKNDYLDKPYNDAMTDWNNRGNRLSKGAELEEKDINNRVKTYRDFLSDKDKTDATAETTRFHDMQGAHWKAQDSAATKRMASQGWNFSTRATDGHRIASRINPDSPAGVDTLDLGKFGETPEEKDSRDTKNFGIRSNITGQRLKNIFDYEEPKRVADQKEMVDYREGYKLDAAERKKMEKTAADKNSPQRDFAIKALALRDVLDENPDLAKKGWFGTDAKINLRTLDYDGTDPKVDKLVKAAIAKWTSKYEKSSTKTTPTTKTPSTGKAILMKDKNGKEWNVAPEHVEAFKKANGIQ